MIIKGFNLCFAAFLFSLARILSNFKRERRIYSCLIGIPIAKPSTTRISVWDDPHSRVVLAKLGGSNVRIQTHRT